MIIWKAIINTNQRLGGRWKRTVRRDTKEKYERTEGCREAAVPEQIQHSFTLKCTFWQMTCIYLTGLISVLGVDLKCNLSGAAKCGRRLCTWSCDGPEELSNANTLHNQTKRPRVWSDGGWDRCRHFTGSQRIRVELIGGVPPLHGEEKTLGKDD